MLPISSALGFNPDWDSGLIERCRKSWDVPIDELSNEMLATFLRQEIAVDSIFEEATRRLNAGFKDDSEMYDGELAEMVQESHERFANDRNPRL